MTDRYEKIRKALEMGPTPGPWVVRYDYVVQARSYEDGRLVPVVQPYGVNRDGTDLFANARLIAACDPDTIRELLDEIEALRRDAARWRYVAQFMRLDDVGDDQYCLGLIVDYESLEEMVTVQAARLDDERIRMEWADVQGAEDSPKTLPPITLEEAIDAALRERLGVKHRR